MNVILYSPSCRSKPVWLSFFWGLGKLFWRMMITERFWCLLTSIVFFCSYNRSQYKLKQFGYQQSSEYLAKVWYFINFADKTFAGNRNNKRLLESFQYFWNIKEYMQKYKDTKFIGGAQSLCEGLPKCKNINDKISHPLILYFVPITRRVPLGAPYKLIKLPIDRIRERRKKRNKKDKEKERVEGCDQSYPFKIRRVHPWFDGVWD